VVDACYKAIARISGSRAKLLRYTVSSVTAGTDAQGEVSCMLQDKDVNISGKGSHTDIIMASALAYVNALNRLEYRKRHRQASVEGGP